MKNADRTGFAMLRCISQPLAFVKLESAVLLEAKLGMCPRVSDRSGGEVHRFQIPSY
jgi:hypothetical protein